MRNVHYHFTDHVAVHIGFLQGELQPRGDFPIFDDKQSFILEIRSAEMSLSADDLSNILNQHVFNAPDTPIKDVRVATQSGKLKVTGKLHSKGNIPFETFGMITPTDDGKIRIHAEKIKAAHLSVKGLMDLLGVTLADLIKTSKARAIAVDKDDLILDPAQALPPPQISGRVTAIRIEGDRVVHTFGSPPRVRRPVVPGNYMAYSGARLQFGKLLMSDTDLILIDMDPQDPFDFYLDHYKEQLTAGCTKTTASFGLRTYMRDYDKLGKKSSKLSKGGPSLRR